ncbi:MAG TPA: monofunctional biosynthetic peptidoglycan transglycosylase [Vicinamibacterales bacterium]|nr:monofunctional biosynthetic peptidoglycan transglycosylase [Vicinamibacterales bacterium]
MPGKKGRSWWRWLASAGALVFAAVGYTYMTIPDVRPLATANPKTTAFMELRARESERDGKPFEFDQRWVPYSRISTNLKRAVLAAEDSAFWQHEGIDVEQIRVSVQQALDKGIVPRGASTLTQQLAKNLYLSPSRDPLRKLRELVITRRLEAGLSKQRIFEIYLNVVEWGDGVWGAEAAARHYFGVPASALSRQQAALLAGALINPRRYNPGRPPARLMRRQQIILARMGTVEPPIGGRPSAAPPPNPEAALPLDDEVAKEPGAPGVPIGSKPPAPEPPAEPAPEPAPEPAAPSSTPPA